MDKQTLPNILRLCHIRIGDGAGRAEGLLHRMGADPADHVQHSASLVVGAGGPRPAEGLLSHHGAGALVVDVEVS